jgi:hypothetical protein
MTASQVYLFIFKALISGILIAAISTVARVSPKWAALLTALPLITFLSMIWIYLENKDLALLHRYTWDVLLWTLPSIIFFFTAIILFKWRVPFFLTLALATLALAGGLYIFQKIGIIK